MITAVCFICLHIPTIWEIINDWYGDFNKGIDVVVRIAFSLAVAALAWMFDAQPFLIALAATFGIFFMYFDYIITWRLIKAGKIEPPRGVKVHWFTTLGKKGWFDNISHWAELNPKIRLAIRVAIYLPTQILYLW